MSGRPGPPAADWRDPPPEPAIDARLLLAAISAWAMLAAFLGLSGAGRLVAAVCAGVLAGGAALLGGRGGRGAPAAWTVLSLAGMTSAFVLLSAGIQGVLAEHGPVRALAVERATVTAEVVLTADPQRLAPDARGGDRVRATGQVRQIWGRGASASCATPVLLLGSAALLESSWRDVVVVDGTLRVAEDSAVLAVLQVRGSPRPVAAAPWWVGFGEPVRAGLRAAVAAGPQDPRALVPALVVGDTSLFPEDLTDAMRRSGLAHLNAVSGANVSIVLGAVLWVAARLGLRRRSRIVLGALGLAAFVVVARPEPSVVRAALMGAVGLVALLAARRGAAAPALGAAIVVALIVDPWLARSVGFLLSALATAGLVFLARDWGDRLAARWPDVARPLAYAVAVASAAQVTTGPVVAAMSGYVSLAGVLANVLVAPLVPVTTLLGVATSLLALLSPAAAGALGMIACWPAAFITGVARRFGEMGSGTVPWPGGWAGALLLTALSLAVLLWAASAQRVVRRRPVGVLAVVLLGGALTLPTHWLTWPPPGWVLVFCDVGQGDAAVVRSGPGRAVLLDAGPDPERSRECLDRLGVGTLDLVVLTHFHLDHVGGLSGALAGRHTELVLTGPLAEPEGQVREVARATAGLPRRVVQPGEVYRVGEVQLTVLAPARRIASGSAPNNNSVVVLVEAFGVRTLFSGDLEREAASELAGRIVREPALAAAVEGLDILKSPHHGSANLDERFMALVMAPVAVISVGADNDFGHPTPEHLRMLREGGSEVFRTDRDGAVAVTVTDEGGVRVVTARARGSP